MRTFCYCLIVCGLMVEFVHADEIRATFAMDSDPLFVVPSPTKAFPTNYRPLWGQALARPEYDLQRKSADAIADAHEFGFPKMAEFQPRLLEIVTADGSHPTARYAAARALIALDTRSAAPALFNVSRKQSIDLRQLIEPVLGDWKYQPITEVWRSRMSAVDVGHRDLMLAINCSARAGDGEALPLLLKIMHEPLRSPVARLEAAQSAGRLRESGLEPEAARLTASQDAPKLHRLCAVKLFSRHSSEGARAALVQLAGDREPTVAAAALERLLAINPDLVVPLAATAMQNRDPIVRLRGTEAYIARPNPERVVSLVRLLDDVHPGVRGSVREALYVLTKTPEFDAVLRPAIMEMLAANGWRGQEQAALLLGALDHEVAGKRLIELLESPRPEVLTSAAWSLKKLAAPENLPALLDKAERQTKYRKQLVEAKEHEPDGLDNQVVHLFECMGLMKYAPAEPLMRVHIPKSPDYGMYSRGAAIWALGYLHEGQPDEPLAKLLTERMKDLGTTPAESPHVQMMCVISLGRMKAKSQAPEIRKLLYGGGTEPAGDLVKRWAMTQLTGETFPDLVPGTFSKSGWFLTPLEE